jgi:predicted methyltransferase MtxX (methanogen marker protein 4)
LIGGGGAFGAPVMDALPRVFVDVSRAMEDYTDSILLSAALASLAIDLALPS